MNFVDLSHPISNDMSIYPSDPDVSIIREKNIEAEDLLDFVDVRQKQIKDTALDLKKAQGLIFHWNLTEIPTGCCISHNLSRNVKTHCFTMFSGCPIGKHTVLQGFLDVPLV